MVLTIMKGVAHTTPVVDSIIILASDCMYEPFALLAWH